MSDTTVIICAYTLDRWDDLLEAVTSIRRQTVQPLEVIVVIDHNPELLARAQETLHGALVLPNRETKGLSGARNTGIAEARGAFIAFMDEDAVAAPDWLALLRAGFTSEQVMGVGGAIQPRWDAGRPAWFPPEFDWVVGCTYAGMPESGGTVRNLIGCNMAFRQDVLRAVGGFRSGIGRVGTRPVGCEETELCIRALQHWPGRVFKYEPRARVSHRVPAVRSSLSYFRRRCYSEGLSKALVAQLVGANDGLSSERTHAARTLPQAALRNLAAVLTKGEVAGVTRAGAIAFGLACAGAGYAVGLASERKLAHDIRAVDAASAPQHTVKPFQEEMSS
jgi:glycosyltransferase involved in cell wall biosynthesis